jgi:hypothetical protein
MFSEAGISLAGAGEGILPAGIAAGGRQASSEKCKMKNAKWSERAAARRPRAILHFTFRTLPSPLLALRSSELTRPADKDVRLPRLFLPRLFGQAREFRIGRRD